MSKIKPPKCPLGKKNRKQAKRLAIDLLPHYKGKGLVNDTGALTPEGEKTLMELSVIRWNWLRKGGGSEKADKKAKKAAKLGA